MLTAGTGPPPDHRPGPETVVALVTPYTAYVLAGLDVSG